MFELSGGSSYRVIGSSSYRDYTVLQRMTPTHFTLECHFCSINKMFFIVLPWPQIRCLIACYSFYNYMQWSCYYSILFDRIYSPPFPFIHPTLAVMLRNKRIFIFPITPSHNFWVTSRGNILTQVPNISQIHCLKHIILMNLFLSHSRYSLILKWLTRRWFNWFMCRRLYYSWFLIWWFMLGDTPTSLW